MITNIVSTAPVVSSSLTLNLEPERLVALGLSVGLNIQLAYVDQLSRQSRWDRVRGYYYNTPPAIPADKLPFVNSSDLHLPITKVKIDALTAQVIGTLMSGEPYVVAQAYNDHSSEVNEKIVHFFLEQANLEKSLRQAGSMVGWAGIGHLVTTWKHSSTLPGVLLEAPEPQDTVVYPATLNNLSSMKVIAKRFYRRRKEVEEMQARGLYASSAPVISGDDPGITRMEAYPSDSGITISSHSDADDGLVMIWRVWFKHDLDGLGEKWYVGTMLDKAKTFLLLQEYPYSRAQWSPFVFEFEPGGYWPSTSIGNSLQGIQIEVNMLTNQLLDGLSWNINGMIYTAGAIPTKEQYKQMKPGTINQTPNPTQMQYFNPKADLQYILPAIQWLTQYSDSVVRISQVGAGAQLQKGTSATEAALIGQGQQAGIDEYIATFSEGLEDLADLVLEMAKVHWNEWFPIYGEFLKLVDADRKCLDDPVIWRARSKSVGNTPASQIQSMQMLAQMSANPQFGFDVRAIGERIAQNLERQGVTDATGVQMPDNGEALVLELAQKMNLDPHLLASAFASALPGLRQASAQIAAGGQPGQTGGQPSQPGGNMPANGIQGSAQPGGASVIPGVAGGAVLPGDGFASTNAAIARDMSHAHYGN